VPATFSTDDVRRRLDAIAGIAWGVTYTPEEEEWWCHLVHVGPVTMEAIRPEDKGPDHRVAALEKRRRQQAIIDFLRHAADDLRALLDDRERAQGGL